MKRAFAFGIAVLLCICGSSVLAKSLDQTNAVIKYLESHPEEGSMTVGEWMLLSPANSHLLTASILQGFVSGNIITSSSGIEQKISAYPLPMMRQTSRIYLLSGWKMPATTYAEEVARVLRDRPGDRGIGSSFVQVEASFARKAEERTRYLRLAKAAEIVSRYDEWIPERDSHTIHPDWLDYGLSRDQWQSPDFQAQRLLYSQGFLEGIALSHARVSACIVKSDISFSVNQISSEMADITEHHGVQPSDKLLLLAMKANASLMEKATVK